MRPPWVVTTKPDGVAGGALDVEREHEHLGAEPVGDLVDQRRDARSRREFTPILSAPTGEQARDVVGRAHSAADGERDEDLLGRAPDHVVGRGALVDGGGHVEERELVGALLEVLAARARPGRPCRAGSRS